MRSRPSTRAVVIGGIVVAVLLAAVVSFYASGSPDGLERVAETLGFADTAKEHAAGDSPLADYGLAGVGNDRLSGGLAGLVGILVVGAVMFGLTRLLRRGERTHRER